MGFIKNLLSGRCVCGHFRRVHINGGRCKSCTCLVYRAK